LVGFGKRKLSSRWFADSRRRNDNIACPVLSWQRLGFLRLTHIVQQQHHADRKQHDLQQTDKHDGVSQNRLHFQNPLRSTSLTEMLTGLPCPRQQPAH